MDIDLENDTFIKIDTNNCVKKETSKPIISVNYIPGACSVPAYLQKTSHPLMLNIPELTLNHPLVNSILDENYQSYLLYVSHITKLASVSDNVKMQSVSGIPLGGSKVNSGTRKESCGFSPLRMENGYVLKKTDKNIPSVPSTENVKKCLRITPKRDQYSLSLSEPRQDNIAISNTADKENETRAKIELLNMFGQPDAIEILNWMALISLYIRKNSIKLEPFQKTSLLHMIYFAATTRIPQYMHLIEKLIFQFFGETTTSKEELRGLVDNFKQKICVALVPRRMGKTFITQIAIAAGALTTTLRFAYFSHTHELSRQVKMALVSMVKTMQNIINELPNGEAKLFRVCKEIQHPRNDTRLSLKFQQGPDTEVSLLSLGNKQVSILRIIS